MLDPSVILWGEEMDERTPESGVMELMTSIDDIPFDEWGEVRTPGLDDIAARDVGAEEEDDPLGLLDDELSPASVSTSS